MCNFNFVLLLFGCKLGINGKPHDLTVSEIYEEVTLDEQLARLIGVDFIKSQDVCGSDVSPGNCLSCAYSGYCVTGGLCCKLKSAKMQMIGKDEMDCPSNWVSECTSIHTIEINGQQIWYNFMMRDGLMCVCIKDRQCCSKVMAPVTTKRFYYFNYDIKTTPSYFG